MFGPFVMHEVLAALPRPTLVEPARRARPIIQPEADPCDGQERNHVVHWYRQGRVLYPLRCGRRAPAGWGYLHIWDDVPRARGVHSRRPACRIGLGLGGA